MSPVQKRKALQTKTFISEHIEEIDKENAKNLQDDKEVSQQSIRRAVKMVKSKVYINMLYPNYKSLPFKEQRLAFEEQRFIFRQLDKIEEHMDITRAGIADGEIENMSEQEIISSAIDYAKRVMKMQRAAISTTDIESRVNKYLQLLHSDTSKYGAVGYRRMQMDKEFIQNNLSRIDDLYFRTEQSSSISGITPQKNIEMSVKRLKIEEYKRMIAPNGEMSYEDEEFLIENFDNIENGLAFYESRITPESVRKMIAVQKYLKELHPDMSEYTQRQKMSAMTDESIIVENFYDLSDRIDRTIEVGNGNKDTIRGIIRYAVVHEKADRYMKLLYPNFEQLTPSERWAAEDDRFFIEDNIDEIDSRYKTVALENGIQGNRAQIIANLLKDVKDDLAKHGSITPESIEDTAKNMGITGDEFNELSNEIAKDVKEMIQGKDAPLKDAQEGPSLD